VDDRHFDAVARTLASARSRRQALRLLAAGALAAWLPRGGVAALALQECEAGLTYCPEQPGWQPAGCYDLLSDYYHCGSCDRHCPSAGGPAACIGGECVATGCPEGWTDCTGNLDCVDLFSDPFNCGACGVVCESGVCEAGFCAQVGCAAGLTYCEEQPGWAPAGCYDLSSDYLHCGSCMHQCPSAGPVAMACVGGECAVTGCGDLTDCTGNLDCTDLGWDANNCGACGNVCASGVCEAGVCAPAGCGSGLAYCPSRQISIGFDNQPYELPAGCYDLFSDRDHCGSCDVTCPTTVGCYAGECTLPPCEGGLIRCDGAGCVELLSDPNHCGACDIVCAAGEVCDGGVCGADTTCAAGLTYCPAKTDPVSQPAGCYDLSSDYTHCGSCDNSCPIASPGPMACIAGQCQHHCEAGFTLCQAPPYGYYCADLSSDLQNCGTCTTTCAAGEVCEAGTCTSTTTRAASDDPTPTTTPAADETTREQEAQGSEETRPTRTPRELGTADTAQAAAESVLAWPFDTEAGQWTIVHGYRAEDEDTNTAATPPADRRDFTRLALEFAVCPEEDVDAGEGTCDLGEAGGDPSWDQEATQGSTVVSPVDGTVVWTEGEAACLAVAIDVAGHSGYRVALYNVEGALERGQRLTRGKRLGRVARRGCERGGRIRMSLYQPQPGTPDDPIEERDGVPFAGEWTIDGCDYPDDRRTVEQYRGELVPCTPVDETSAGS
jgi:hypothetical protein